MGDRHKSAHHTGVRPGAPPAWKHSGARRRRGYGREALVAVSETVLAMTEPGVMDKRILKVFGEMCLTGAGR